MTVALSAPAVPARLPPNSVYRSLKGRAEFMAFYDGALERLPFPVEGREIQTRFGRTHLGIGGNAAGPPLIVLPGMSIPSPLMLEFFQVHARDHLLIAPDLIGHPGRSEDRVHTARNHGFGLWLADLLDGLGLEKAEMVSGSFGSSFALDLATFAPERVGRQGLVVPAGLTPNLPYLTIYATFLITWFAYRYWPDRTRLASISQPLVRSLTPENYTFLDIVIRETAFFRHRPAGPFFPKDLAGYREPVLLVTAGEDRLFPRDRTRANAIAALNVVDEIFLPNARHMPGSDEMAEVHRRLALFLKA